MAETQQKEMSFTKLMEMEEAIESKILEVRRQMKFMATKYDYHFKGNVAEIMEKLKQRLQAAISFYTTVIGSYEKLRNDHEALEKQISSFKTIFATLIEKYDLASTIEESILVSEVEDNKENLPELVEQED